MRWSLEVSTAPSLELLTLSEAKEHLRVSVNVHEDDGLIGDLSLAVTEEIQSHCSIALLTQILKLRLDTWPRSGRVYLPRRPLQSVGSISYKEAVAGAATTLSSSLYTVYGARTTPDAYAPLGYIEPAYGKSWPSLYPVPEAVTVTYTCGWLSTEDVPVRIKQAAKVMLGDLYEQRQTVIAGSSSIVSLPTVNALLANEVVHHEFNEDCG